MEAGPVDGQVDVISASAWAKKRKVQTEILTLPSGASIEIARTKISAFLMMDIMPMALLSSTSKESKGDANEGVNTEESLALAKGLKKISQIIQRAVIKPRIIFDGTPKAGEVSAEDVPPEDIEFLMSYVLRTKESEDLEPFRVERSGSDARSPVQKIRATPVKRSRNK